MRNLRKLGRPVALTLGIYLLLFVAIVGFRRHAMAATPAQGTTSATLTSGGLERTYLVHLPPGYNGKTPLPLVLVLHGATESPENVERLSGMSEKADRENFIAVYPRGTGTLPTWNSGACCAYAMKEHIDDVAFFHALLDKLQNQYAIDAKRIYATGISNGGMMSYRLACEMSDTIAAISPVEGSQDIACTPAHPVSVIVFHGTADHLVPFNGGSTPYQMGSKRSDTPVAETVAFWVKQDGCSAIAKHEVSSEVRVDKYSACKDGSAVELYAIQGGHHMWPGVKISGNSVPATDLMWAFFAAHPKP
jgi:polyhydroxybutyrate depolymerase